MTHTLRALLSRDFPYPLAANLIAKGETISSLARRSDKALMILGLSGKDIESIRDRGRPPIPAAILRKVLEDSWRTCCVCRKPDKPIVVHHIEEWANGGRHEETNLVVLCLEDHDKAHTKAALSLNLSANDIRAAKATWIHRAAMLRDNYHKALLNPGGRSARWYWIHVDKLRQKTFQNKSLSSDLGREYVEELIKTDFITTSGKINPDAMWKEGVKKSKKMFLFDSSPAQLMALYVSDVLGRLVLNSPILDLSGMLADSVALDRYLSRGSLVYFRDQVEIDDKLGQLIHARISNTGVRLQFAFDPWMSLNHSAKGVHLPMEVERSVIGEVDSVVWQGKQLRIQISPLGISPDFVIHRPAQGGFVKGANNEGLKSRQKSAGV